MLRDKLEVLQGLDAEILDSVALVEEDVSGGDIARHMDNLEGVASQHHLRNLRRLYDEVESHIRDSHSLGTPTSLYGGLLTSTRISPCCQ